MAASIGRKENNQPTAQFYHVIADNRFPYYVYGAQQDNTTVAIASRGSEGPIDRQDWYPVGGGEAGYIAPDPRDPLIVYAGDYQGKITRFDKHTGQLRNITVHPVLSDGKGAAGSGAPLPVDRAAADFAPRSRTCLSRRRTHLQDHRRRHALGSHQPRPHAQRQDQAARPPAARSPLTTPAPNITTPSSPWPNRRSEKGLIWAGTDDGLLHITRDGGKNWTNITPKDLPEWSKISQIDRVAARCRHRLGRRRPARQRRCEAIHLRHHAITARPGRSSATAFPKAPSSEPCAKIRSAQRPAVRRHGNGCLLFRKIPALTWDSLQLNLPTVPVHDLVVKDNDLALATHGRAFWISTTSRRCAKRPTKPPKPTSGFTSLPLRCAYTPPPKRNREPRRESSSRRIDLCFHVAPNRNTPSWKFSIPPAKPCALSLQMRLKTTEEQLDPEDEKPKKPD